MEFSCRATRSTAGTGGLIQSRMSMLLAATAVAGAMAAVVPAVPAMAKGIMAPPARCCMGMAYDVARGQVVLFGGNNAGYLGDTWTWDGTDWTERSPAHAPSARCCMGMTDDAARGRVVLFGGYNYDSYVGDTWTWDGTDWTERTPAHAPSARCCMGMASDAARSQVVLFGGSPGAFFDTWTWEGTDWTERTTDHAPSARGSMGTASDAARAQVVLFGGLYGSFLGDTWTWDGTDWGIPFRASLKLKPKSGPPGTVVTVLGSGFGGAEKVVLTFMDSVTGTTKLGVVETDGTGAFTTQVTIPLNATAGTQQLKAKGRGSGQPRKKAFTVT